MVYFNHVLYFIIGPLQFRDTKTSSECLGVEPFIEVACMFCRAAEHSVDLPAVFVFPSWRMHTATILPMSASVEELLSCINTALLHSMVIKPLSQI